jgi:hypothetical protein
MDPGVHKRFLDYRDSYVYFGKEAGRPALTMEEFTTADAEQRELDGKGNARDDEEEARFAELCRLLFRD